MSIPLVNSLENYIRSVISPSSLASALPSELIIISHAMPNENNKKKSQSSDTKQRNEIKRNEMNGFLGAYVGGKLKTKV